MDNITLADYRTRVSKATGFSNSDSTEQGLIDDFVNEGIEQFMADTGCWVLRDEVDLTADTVDYTLDTDIVRVKQMILNGDWAMPLEPMDPMEMLARRASESSADIVRYYAIQGYNFLMIHGTPSTGDTLDVIYVPKPPTLSSVGDYPLYIPARWHCGPEYYAKMKCSESDQSRETENGAYYKALYEDAVRKCIVQMNRARGKLPPARPGRSRNYVPPRNGIDWFPR